MLRCPTCVGPKFPRLFTGKVAANTVCVRVVGQWSDRVTSPTTPSTVSHIRSLLRQYSHEVATTDARLHSRTSATRWQSSIQPSPASLLPHCRVGCDNNKPTTKQQPNNKQQTTQRHNTQTTHHHRGGGLCVCVCVSVTAGELASTIVWSFYNRNQSLFTTWRADAGRRIVFSTFDCRAIFGTSHYRTTTTAISRSDVKPI